MLGDGRMSTCIELGKLDLGHIGAFWISKLDKRIISHLGSA